MEAKQPNAVEKAKREAAAKKAAEDAAAIKAAEEEAAKKEAEDEAVKEAVAAFEKNVDAILADPAARAEALEKSQSEDDRVEIRMINNKSRQLQESFAGFCMVTGDTDAIGDFHEGVIARTREAIAKIERRIIGRHVARQVHVKGQAA